MEKGKWHERHESHETHFLRIKILFCNKFQQNGRRSLKCNAIEMKLNPSLVFLVLGVNSEVASRFQFIFNIHIYVIPMHYSVLYVHSRLGVGRGASKPISEKRNTIKRKTISLGTCK